MVRWEPDAENRFRLAALELFEEIGYEQTTVAAIAERAGLTSRTFFRYFVDKREVLFVGSQQLQDMLVDGLAKAPAGASAIDAVASALTSAGGFFDDDRRRSALARYTVISAHPELRERELIKLATLSAALAQGLRARGVGEPDASLVAEAGIVVFRIAFEQWISASEQRDYDEIVNAALARLKTLTASLTNRSADNP